MQPVQRGSSRPQLGNVKLEVLLTGELPCCIGSGIYISLKFRAEVQAQLKQLKDRDLFLSGRMMGPFGIVWNDDLDIETETIYEDGVTVRQEKRTIHQASSQAVCAARAAAGISQKQLAVLTGIDQSDISKIERGLANPSVATLDRIANALGGQLKISIEVPTNA